jgi:SAM-dependent methyltransferase
MFSFSPGDAVRHHMYAGIWQTLQSLPWTTEPKVAIEIGSLNPSSTCLSMLANLAVTHGFDLQREVADFMIGNHDDIQKMRWSDGAFDVFIADQVLEHVERIWDAAKEVCRVLKPGGLAIMTTPFLLPLHDCPVDCWRITPHGYRVLFPEPEWETLSVGQWGGKSEMIWSYEHTAVAGWLGRPVSVDEALRDMPGYAEPKDDAYPVVVWWVGRKR